jgi:hypothetical protein
VALSFREAMLLARSHGVEKKDNQAMMAATMNKNDDSNKRR